MALGVPDLINTLELLILLFIDDEVTELSDPEVEGSAPGTTPLANPGNEIPPPAIPFSLALYPA